MKRFMSRFDKVAPAHIDSLQVILYSLATVCDTSMRPFHGFYHGHVPLQLSLTAVQLTKFLMSIENISDSFTDVANSFCEITRKKGKQLN